MGVCVQGVGSSSAPGWLIHGVQVCQAFEPGDGGDDQGVSVAGEKGKGPSSGVFFVHRP